MGLKILLQACWILDTFIVSYGKGRAANESETKPPNLDKNQNSKTANGRRVPLTDLLGQAIPTKAQPPPNKTDRLAPMSSERQTQR